MTVRPGMLRGACIIVETAEGTVGKASGYADLLADLPDARAARTAIERLSRSGVDGGAIELLGPVEVVTDGRYGDRQTDLGSSLALGGRSLRGAAWGVVPGAVFGAILLAVAGTPRWPVLLAGAGGGGLLGAGVGVLVALLSVPSMARSWERTFAPLVPGGVTVGVRVEDARTRRRARRVLGRAATVREVPDLDDVAHEPPAGTDP